MTEFETQVLSMLKNVDNRMNNIENDVSSINKRLDKIETDIEVIKEDVAINRVASNANGQKLEELEKLLKELDVIA